jgi:hypothetical protein
MKFKIIMKDPDGVWGCLRDAAIESANAVDGISQEERDALIESRRESLGALCNKWFEYDEYLTVEIDTEAKTIVVWERK